MAKRWSVRNGNTCASSDILDSMKARIDHVGINVRDLTISREFYGKLLPFLGFREHDDGWITEHNGVWLYQAEHGEPFREHAHSGINHLSFRVEKHEEIDVFCKEFLEPNGVPALYGGPKEYPEYTAGYYAVFFKDPDGFKLEVLHFPH